MKSYGVFLLLSFLAHLFLFSVAFSLGAVEKPVLNLEIRSIKTASPPPKKKQESRRANPPPKIRNTEPELPSPEKPLNPSPLTEPKAPLLTGASTPASPSSTSEEPTSGNRPMGQDTGSPHGTVILPSDGVPLRGGSTTEGNGTDALQNTESILQAYLMEVFKKIDSGKEYPKMALKLEQQGKVEVEFSIQSDGKVEDIHIRKGSGFRLLDDAAVEAIRKASPFPPIPESLKQQKISASITLLFTLSG